MQLKALFESSPELRDSIIQTIAKHYGIKVTPLTRLIHKGMKVEEIVDIIQADLPLRDGTNNYTATELRYNLFGLLKTLYDKTLMHIDPNIALKTLVGPKPHTKLHIPKMDIQGNPHTAHWVPGRGQAHF